jgi:hypothetical protein
MLTIGLIAFTAWMGILVVAVAMCRAAARADATPETLRAQHVRREAPTVSKQPARPLTLIGG